MELIDSGGGYNWHAVAISNSHGIDGCGVFGVKLDADVYDGQASARQGAIEACEQTNQCDRPCTVIDDGITWQGRACYAVVDCRYENFDIGARNFVVALGRTTNYASERAHAICVGLNGISAPLVDAGCPESD